MTKDSILVGGANDTMMAGVKSDKPSGKTSQSSNQGQARTSGTKVTHVSYYEGKKPDTSNPELISFNAKFTPKKG